MFDILLVPPLWLYVLGRARSLRVVPRRARILWIMWLIWAVTVTMGVPAVRRILDSAVGLQSFTNLPVHMLSLCAMAAFFEFVRESTGGRHPSGAWPRWTLLGIAEVGLAATFLNAPLPDGETDLVTQTHVPMLQAYWTFFLSYIVFGVVSALRLCWRYGRLASPGPSRTSMTLLGIGSCLGLLYVLHRLAYLVAAIAGWHNTAGVTATTQVLLGCTLAALMAGMSWPTLADRLRRRRLRRDARALRPLWERLTEVTPEVVLPLPTGLDRDDEFVRYRLLIEMRDAALALSAHIRPEHEARVRSELAAATPPPADLDASTEAALLLFAVATERAGVNAVAPPRTCRRPLLSEGADLESETAWLRRVTTAMTTRPVQSAAHTLASTRLEPT
ncbi:hypothetical protein DEJ50_04670 [Streptomyces venezuelae]|uniref:DUF6545 domain-containing protein n=1 Tax=Streptomyces venezuelae TaxID=54571 RepID=A0A5P2D1K3_STRVZ|nr:hypothetical protein DEJ50_04670 [Streptomyces venezuelae]